MNIMFPNAFVGYKVDTNHRYKSRNIICICDNAATVIGIMQQDAKIEGFEIDQIQTMNLHNIKQTQGYEGPGEYQYESIIKNKLL